ncbi:MAG: hypothetical protein ACM3XZ_05160 [Betaproteobacteria bacterium]
MSKKKRAAEDSQPAEERQYDLGQWNGLPQYRCRLCPFDTLDEAAMKRHIEERHTVRPATVPVEVPLLDRFGNPITEREVS